MTSEQQPVESIKACTIRFADTSATGRPLAGRAVGQFAPLP